MSCWRKLTCLPTDPWLHLVRDAASEKKWGFRLSSTLKKSSGKDPLLSGYRVYATKSVLPPPAELKGTVGNVRTENIEQSFIKRFISDIVEFAGGKWAGCGGKPPSANSSAAQSVLVLSTAEDLAALQGKSDDSGSAGKRSARGKAGGKVSPKKSAAASAASPVAAYDTELLLSGLLKRQLDFKKHALHFGK